jgi:hypothetical protein
MAVVEHHENQATRGKRCGTLVNLLKQAHGALLINTGRQKDGLPEDYLLIRFRKSPRKRNPLIENANSSLSVELCQTRAMCSSAAALMGAAEYPDCSSTCRSKS